MGKPDITLSAREMQTLRFALCCAIEERQSLADAYSGNGPHAKRAMDAAARFEKLHLKMFGCDSAVKENAERLAAMPTVSIFDLIAGPEQN